MKRDADLIRSLLLAIEKREEPFLITEIALDQYDSAQIAHHAALLSDAGFVDGEDRRITFSGYEFLDAIRPPSVWRKTRDRIDRAGGGFVFAVIKDVAVSLLRQKLGL